MQQNVEKQSTNNKNQQHYAMEPMEYQLCVSKIHTKIRNDGTIICKRIIGGRGDTQVI